jgi:hypothetical protein
MPSVTKNSPRFAWTAATLLALAAVALVSPSARADYQYISNPGSDNDGTLSAEAYFTLQSNQITVYLANLISGNQAQGQAISGVTFTVSGLTGSLSLQTVSGTEAMLDNGSFTSPSYKTFSASGTPAEAANWAYGDNADINNSKTAALNAFQDNTDSQSHPFHMIVGPSANFSGGGGGNFNPYFLSAATSAEDLATAPQGDSVQFVLSAPGVTAGSTISSVSLFFGTGADKELGSTGGFTNGGGGNQGGPVPEPGSLALLGIGCTSLFGWMASRRRRVGKVAA